ncbi:hypothetical protein EMN47_01615 [Prolixibacteraceae bacterium JC049]|nr:hypothetical protein [Prolixibacteraceae bacterium JC049]
MKQLAFIIFFSFTSFILCAQENQFSLFVLGNSNIENQHSKLLLKEIQHQISQTENEKAIIHLGNKKSNTDFNQAILHFKTLKDAPLFIAPGPGEWNGGKENGKKFLQNLADSLENSAILPDASCPGPKEIALSDRHTLILLDTQWWLHAFDRRYAKCDIEEDADVIVQLQDALRRNRDKQIILAAHHNLFSQGNSGGKFSFKQWTTQAPVTLYRKLIGGKQDIKSPEYSYFRDAFWSVLKQFKQSIYLSAGDKNFQFSDNDSIYQINSGSFSQTAHVTKPTKGFTAQKYGFTRINFRNDNTIQIQFIGTDSIIWEKELQQSTVDIQPQFAKRHFPDSITMAASSQYIASKKQSRWMGNNYREVWKTPIKVPVFDIEKAYGGLSIIKRGGGQQTHSIRMKDKNGKQYVLRSLEKYVAGALPKELKNTFAIDLAQDFISSSNPYGAIPAAQLAEAAGVYHTNPSIVYVPNDPTLEQYQEDLGGHLFLFEERPAGDRSDEKHFGNSTDLVNTDEVLKKTHKRHSAQANQKEVLRARLLDIIINDWDRHDDQWRWATHKKNGKTHYRPIPRDRDQAFYKADGILPWLVARKWILPKFQGIDTITHNVEGLSFNARYFDRTFLTSLDWNDWQQIITELQQALTDQKIDEAMLHFPKEIYPLCGKTTAQTIKARVRNLKPMAHQLYRSLSKAVEVVGTKKDDRITIEGNGNQLLVQIQNKKKSTTSFSRSFTPSETEEVHIYGLDGNDRVHFSGTPVKGIRIRVIGGENKDKVINDSNSKWQATIYDKKSTKLEGQHPIKLKSNIYKSAVEYDRLRFKYDVTSPGFAFGLNPDDGLIIGGGPIIKKYTRFKEWSHRLVLNHAFSSNSTHFNYEGRIFYPLHRSELILTADIKTPDYQNNFFGLGNETKWLVPKDDKLFYRSPVRFYRTKFQFSKWFDKKKRSQVFSSLTYKSAHVEEHKNRFVNMLSEEDLQETKHGSFTVGYEYNSASTRTLKTEEQFEGSSIFPTKGIHFKADYNYNIGIKSGSKDFHQLNADWRGYLSFSQRPRVVYAFRVGASKNWGNFPFYYAAQLGGKTNLRGYRATRFHGDAAVYQNSEIRVRLGSFNSYVLNGLTGFTLFNDVGRVWLDDEDSSKWHHGYGVGFWVSPFNFAIFNLNLEKSSEDTLVSFKVNFQF